MSDANVPDPFKSAQRRRGVGVWLRPEDVMYFVQALSRDEAERLLEENDIIIASEMVAAGIECIVRILEKTNGHV